MIGPQSPRVSTPTALDCPANTNTRRAPPGVTAGEPPWSKAELANASVNPSHAGAILLMIAPPQSFLDVSCWSANVTGLRWRCGRSHSISPLTISVTLHSIARVGPFRGYPLADSRIGRLTRIRPKESVIIADSICIIRLPLAGPIARAGIMAICF